MDKNITDSFPFPSKTTSDLVSVPLTWIINKMATMSTTTFWAVYKDLCFDVIKSQPDYLLQLIKILKEERPLKVVMRKCV